MIPYVVGVDRGVHSIRGKSMEMTWTPERVELLNQLFEEGLPTSEIGRRMGLTKNTVIGRLHRSAMTRWV